MHIFEMIEQIHDTPHSVQLVSRPGLETGISRIEPETLPFDPIYEMQ